MPAPVRSIRRSSVCLGLIAAAAWAAPGLTARVRPANKTAYVVALDGTTTPYKDLKKEDWGVREDGQDRKVIDAKPATDPLTVVILADVTKFTQMSAKDVRTAVTSFIQTVQTAQPDAQVAIIGFGRQSTTFVELGKPAAGRREGGPADQRRIRTVTRRSCSKRLTEAAKKLSAAASPRRAIVAIDLDGFNEVSAMPPQSVADQGGARVAARRPMPVRCSVPEPPSPRACAARSAGGCARRCSDDLAKARPRRDSHPGAAGGRARRAAEEGRRSPAGTVTRSPTSGRTARRRGCCRWPWRARARRCSCRRCRRSDVRGRSS